MARVPFLVVTRLAVDCILGKTFLDRHVKAILPPQREVVFHDVPPMALVGTTPSRHDRKMAWRSTAQQLPQSDKPERRQVALPANKPSREIHFVRAAIIPPMTQALTMVRAATPVGGYVIQNSPKTAHNNLSLMEQGVIDVVPEKMFSVMLSNVGHCAVQIPRQTVVGLPIPSPTHILTLGESAVEAAKAKEREGIFNFNPSTADDAAGEAADNRTDKGGAEQATPPRAPLGADGPDKPEETAASEEDPIYWQEDVHIGAEDEEVRSEVLQVLSEFKDMWTGRLGKSGPRSTALSSSLGLARFTRRTTAPDQPHRRRRKRRLTGGSGQGQSNPPRLNG